MCVREALRGERSSYSPVGLTRGFKRTLFRVCGSRGLLKGILEAPNKKKMAEGKGNLETPDANVLARVGGVRQGGHQGAL